MSTFGRGRFHPVSPVFDRRNETIASAQRFAAVKWSGRKAGESGQAAGGSVPSQIERRAELAQSLSEKMARLADAGVRAALAVIGWSDSDRESIH